MPGGGYEVRHKDWAEATQTLSHFHRCILGCPDDLYRIFSSVSSRRGLTASYLISLLRSARWSKHPDCCIAYFLGTPALLPRQLPLHSRHIFPIAAPEPLRPTSRPTKVQRLRAAHTLQTVRHLAPPHTFPVHIKRANKGGASSPADRNHHDEPPPPKRGVKGTQSRISHALKRAPGGAANPVRRVPRRPHASHRHVCSSQQRTRVHRTCRQSQVHSQPRHDQASMSQPPSELQPALYGFMRLNLRLHL